MRKITSQAQQAFNANKDWKSGNTMVKTETDTMSGLECTRLYLHGNLIATKDKHGTRVCLAGWPTPTTRERLKAVGARVSQSAGDQWLHNEIGGVTRMLSDGFYWIAPIQY